MSEALRLPQLRGARVQLRAFRVEDGPLIQEVSADPLIPLITSVPREPDGAAALAFIERQHARAITGAGYSFAIVADGRAVGQIGLWRHDLRWGRASVGYWIVASSRRRGLAAEALSLLSAWGLSLPAVERLELYVEPWNEGSWRAAERAGYRREGLLRGWQPVDGQRRDMYMYSLLPGDA